MTSAIARGLADQMAEDGPVKKQAKLGRFFKSSMQVTAKDLEFVTVQVVKAPEKSEKKLEEKVLMGKVREAMLAKWRRGAEKTMTDDGRSRMELLHELVPVAKRVSSDDPAQKAVAEFMKLQQAYEAQDVL